MCSNGAIKKIHYWYCRLFFNPIYYLKTKIKTIQLRQITIFFNNFKGKLYFHLLPAL